MSTDEITTNPADEESRDFELTGLNADGTINWVGLARGAYNDSTSYLDNNIRKQIEKNLANFRSKHPSGSKYYLDSYKYRSRGFRPKSRSSVRRHEAAAALAFFSTLDAVSCTPEDPNDPASLAGSRYGKNWLEYRLEHSIPWFQTLIGGYQDAMVQGVVIGRAEWLYETEDEEVEVPKFDANGIVELDEFDEVANLTETKTNVLVDKPALNLVPLENFRFSTASDWTDPIGTSPFLIELIPMFVCHVKDRMTDIRSKTGEPKWRALSDGEIAAAKATGDLDTTRSAREGKREDSTDQKNQLRDYDIVWVHRNIVEYGGDDWIYYTLGTEHLLSEPVPLTSRFQHGRPYVMGSCIIETHKAYPAASVELTEDLQSEANDLANQRRDNLKLLNNKRYKAVRGAKVDWKALTTSVPGGVVLMENLADVEEMTFSDIGNSVFQEQDRLNADFDDLSGNFSSSSVQTSRSLNDTVGGMAISSDDSNVMTEYQLRVYTETFVEPMLRMMLKMGQQYESDERVLTLVGEGADPQEVAKLMSTAYGVRVAIGFGATSPQKRIEKISIGLGTIGKFLPALVPKINPDEVLREVFGALGYRDGSRFFTKDEEGSNPEVEQLKAQVQELTAQVETKQLDNKTKLDIAQLKEQTTLQLAQFKADFDREMKAMDVQLEYIAHQIAAEKNDIARGELILQQEVLQLQKRDKEIEMLTAHNDRLSSVLMRDDYGMVPAAEG